MQKNNKSRSDKTQAIDENALQILMKEYDALRDMYSQAERNGQSMFNYYLTLMTAVFGGVALVFQPSSGILMQKTAGGLLLIFFCSCWLSLFIILIHKFCSHDKIRPRHERNTQTSN